MVRPRFLASVMLGTAALSAGAAPGQQSAATLTITVVLADEAGAPAPLARHALLVSDSPPSTVPERVLTGDDGSASLNLRPGTYIVESEHPAAFRGRAYRWIESVTVAAGQAAVLALTADNARIGPLSEAGARSGGSGADARGDSTAEVDPWDVLQRWRNSIVALWTPTDYASGFIVDPRGLIASSRRMIGDATDVEVQLADGTKVAGRVLPADPARDVALVRVHPSATTMTPLPLECADEAPPLADGQEVYALGLRLLGPPDMTFGDVHRVGSRQVGADFDFHDVGRGGPVFADGGRVAGLASISDAPDDGLPRDAPIVELAEVCAAIRSADASLDTTPPPADTRLPVEPSTAVSREILADVISRRAGNLLPYEALSADFDLAFLTPIQTYAGLIDASPPRMTFSNWNDYARELAPVLLVRVTPKQSESFWGRLFRGAALMQGASRAPITNYETGFASLRAFCGEDEVTPIHVLTIVTRLSETDAVREGLAVFAPDALTPDCGTVRFLLSSEKAPDEIDTREIDPSILRRIREDFGQLSGT